MQLLLAKLFSVSGNYFFFWIIMLHMTRLYDFNSKEQNGLALEDNEACFLRVSFGANSVSVGSSKSLATILLAQPNISRVQIKSKNKFWNQGYDCPHYFISVQCIPALQSVLITVLTWLWLMQKFFFSVKIGFFSWQNIWPTIFWNLGFRKLRPSWKAFSCFIIKKQALNLNFIKKLM